MTAQDSLTSASDASWRTLLRGADGLRIVALCVGVALHAINLYLATTLLPSVVREIGGIDYYAWNTSLFVVGSILGSALCAYCLRRIGCRMAYLLAAAVFAAGCLGCAAASAMPAFIAGRFAQGLGGGLLLALPYALIHLLFAPALWPRAMALVSGMWGVATLLGPALGGAFAELGIWRAAFASLAPIALLFAGMALPLLPAQVRTRSVATALPAMQLTLLSAAVLVISMASVVASVAGKLAALVIAGMLLVQLLRYERRASVRLLPRDSLGRSALRPLYVSMALLAVTVTCSEIFVPYFLQELHGLGVLAAGFVAATMSAGWTAGAVAASGVNAARAELLMRVSPWLSILGLATILVLLPLGSSGVWWRIAPMVLALMMVGCAVGMAWPHLATRVIQRALPAESDLAAASIMTVQLVGTALSASLAGSVVNVAGLAHAQGSGPAAFWLFVATLLAPVSLLVTGALRTATSRYLDAE